MLHFRDWLLKEEQKIPQGAIKVRMPGVHQQSNYTCGSAIFRAVAQLFGIDPDLSDKEWAKLMGVSKKDGLPEDKIVQWAKKLGMGVKMKKGMTDEELRSFLDKGMPVICAIQAWGDEKYYKTAESGHWAAAIGYTKRFAIFEDPFMDADPRGYLSWEELDNRWVDRCNDGRCRRLGIALWKNTVEPDRKGRVMKRIK